MNNDDDFKLAMEKFDKLHLKACRIKFLEEFLQRGNGEFESFTVSYATGNDTKKRDCTDCC